MVNRYFACTQKELGKVNPQTKKFRALSDANHWLMIVGFDATPTDRDALAWAIDMADAFDARILVVHALGLLESTEVMHGRNLFGSTAEILQQVIDEVAGKHAPSVELCLQVGEPVDLILDLVRETKPQLVVLGRRHSGDIGTTWLGSVSRRLVSCCPVPTVVVPSPEPDAGSTSELHA
jgi:nucleotide-binding universal stress UspA family protein